MSSNTKIYKKRLKPALRFYLSKHLSTISDFSIQILHIKCGLMLDNKRKINPPLEGGSPEGEEVDKTPARHVLLPCDLRDLNIDIYRGEVCSLLYNIFPGTTNVTEARYRSHLLFQVKELPSSPWPLTVGNAPITILSETSQGRALMFPRQNLGNMSISICRQNAIDKISDRILRELAASVQTDFQRRLPAIHIVEIMFTYERTFYVVLHDNINIAETRVSLPGRIANYPVGYIHDHDLRQPESAIESQSRGGIFDNTAYDVLRPGVLLCSEILAEHEQSVVSTTSGILVKNPAGHCFMTIPSNGTRVNTQIWQATRRDKIVGKVAVEIPFTNISLVELGDDIKFENETFENGGGAVLKFTRLATSEDNTDWPLCYLNSSYTGNMEGSVVMKSVKFEAVSRPPVETRSRLVVYNWSYMGQVEGNKDKDKDKACFPKGTSGSVAWNDDGVVLSFYHHYIEEGKWSGFASLVSASEVIEAGYDLA
ncbi:hypothetical protein F5B19DRAFT_23492 [Rostrohypoxylon terebratum]|nr:hypothetical protein F5B19DRAFT_23492 [Rostrohypoxylon terebratum]